jgi:uncharacterized membrane protein
VSRLLPVLLALAFPLLAHASALSQSLTLATAAVACLVLLLAWPLRVRPLAFVGVLALAAALLTLLWRAGHAHLPLMLPPVLFNAALGLYFARSLAPGRMPLIERIVRALNDGEVRHPDVPAYARRLTRMWALLLLSLAAICAVLGLLATPEGLLHSFGIEPRPAVPLALWSLFANVLNYLIVALVFLLEYVWRKRRFPQHDYGGFIGFLRRVAGLGPAFWRARG